MRLTCGFERVEREDRDTCISRGRVRGRRVFLCKGGREYWVERKGIVVCNLL
jgi:hypothetical protein